VSVTVAFPAPLHCGRPAGDVTLVFPPAAGVPANVAARAVRINGIAAARVAVRGHLVTAAAPRPQGITCGVIARGTETVVIGASAGIRNPRHPGVYRFVVRAGGVRYRVAARVR
jgi:hypothetical protein